MEDDPTRGDRIADLMKTRGHSVASLARAAGRDRSQVYRWIDGKSMGGDVLGSLAIALETSRTYLMTGKQPEGFSPGLPEVKASVTRLEDRIEALATQLSTGLADLRLAPRDEQKTETHPERSQGGQS